MGQGMDTSSPLPMGRYHQNPEPLASIPKQTPEAMRLRDMAEGSLTHTESLS